MSYDVSDHNWDYIFTKFPGEVVIKVILNCSRTIPLCSLFPRTEFKAYKDVKPVKPIKAPSQYKPPAEETSLETSYSATYKGEQVKVNPTDNKVVERRRIRSLYSEPGKEPAKVRGQHTDPLMLAQVCELYCYHHEIPLRTVNYSPVIAKV